MTLSDYAKKYQVTAQAIRNRITRAGYVLDDLREPKSKHFSEKGIKIIDDLLGPPPPPPESSADGPDGSPAPKVTTLAAIRAERDELRIRAATAEAIAADRQKVIDHLTEQNRTLAESIAKLSASLAMQTALPTPAEPDPAVRRGLLSWIRRKRKK